MKTELIQGFKMVVFNGNELVIVTTQSGATIWVPKSQYDPSAETITYKVMKAGDEYTNKAGETAKLLKDRNEFSGLGKQIVKKYNVVEMFTELNKLGITPAINM